MEHYLNVDCDGLSVLIEDEEKPMQDCDLKQFRTIIAAEYMRLCNYLGLIPVPLDIYEALPPEQDRQDTPLGTDMREQRSGYRPKSRYIVLPVEVGSAIPSRLPAFPPTTWNNPPAFQKGDFSPEGSSDPLWPTWRVELWHEVVHQVSADKFNQCDPEEKPLFGTQGRGLGHGLGWARALEFVAIAFHQVPSTLEALL